MKTGHRITEGQRRVGMNFNPSGLPSVNMAQTATATLIDMALETGAKNSNAGRAAAIAATKFEDACMWLVKAQTTQPAAAKEGEK